MAGKAIPRKFSEDDAVQCGDLLEVRIRTHSGEAWFGLFAGGHDRAVFSGMIDETWPDKLRDLADLAGRKLRERDAERRL